MTDNIAIVGAGLIGRAWAIVFARAGMPVALYDIDPGSLDTAREAIRQSLDDLRAAGLLDDSEATLRHIAFEPDLAKALANASYVQECGPENTAAKREIYTELERHVADTTVLASSTSGIAASAFIGDLTHPERCLVAHPVNPPYLVPLVEVVPAPVTNEAAVSITMQLLERVRQAPILVRQEVEGFVLNRLQAALLNEALRLYRGGYVSAADLDKTVKEGLGLRWSFMGPFETIDLNAPGGIADYGQRYGPLYSHIDAQRDHANPWQADTLEALKRELDTQHGGASHNDRQAWRDRRLMALSAHKASQAQ